MPKDTGSLLCVVKYLPIQAFFRTVLQRADVEYTLISCHHRPTADGAIC